MCRWAALWLCSMAASAVNDDGRLYGELISAVNRTDADAIQRLLANKTDAVQLLLRSSVNAWFDGVPAPGEGSLLHFAAFRGDVDVMRLLLDAWPAGLQQRNYRGQALLHHACWNGSMELSQWLLLQWPQGLKVADDWGRTVWHHGARSGNVELLQWLHTQWPGGLKIADADYTAWHYGARSGHVEVLQWLYIQWPEGLKVADEDGQTAWHYGARSGNVEVLQWLLIQWPEGLKVADTRGRTVWYHIARSGNVELLQWLHIQWPERLKVNAGLATAWHHGAWSGNKEVLQWLHIQWPEGLKVADNWGQTVWHYGARSGHVEVLQWLHIQWPEGLKVADITGKTAWHDGAWSGNKEVLQWLHIQWPEGLKVATYSGQTVWHYGARSGHAEVLQWLHIQWPEGLKVADNSGEMPLNYVDFWGKVEFLQWLLTQPEGLIRYVDNWHQTVWHYGARSGHVEVLQWLYMHWAEGLTAYSDMTAWHYGAWSGNVEVLQWLHIQWPEGLKVADTGGQTAWHYGARSGDAEVLQWLHIQWPEGLKVADTWGQTVWHHGAARGGHVLVLQWLHVQWPEGLKDVDAFGDTAWRLGAAESNKEPLQWLVSLWPEGLEVAHDALPHFLREQRPEALEILECKILVPFVCGTSTIDQSWRSAMAELQCASPELLSQSDLQAWLEGCGGRPSWSDDFGTLAARLRDAEAKAFLEPLIGLDGLIVTTLQDWAAWACVVSAASAALAAVCLEARLTKPRGTGVQSYQASSEGVGDDFREGATRCVCQALSPPARFTRAWRWLEVLVATFWLGPAMLVTHWAWWLPIVLVFYAVPAFIFTTANKLRLKLEDADSPIKFTAAKKLRLKLETLLKSPVLVIMTPTTKGPVPQVAGLCRTMALSGVWFAIAHNASQLPLPIVNPDFQDFESKKYAAWRYSHLHHHWMFPWASKTITAANIFDVATTLCPAVIILYSVCLFCASLQHLVPLSAVQRLPAWLKVNKANRHERQKLRDRLLKEKTLPDEVDGRLKPVVLLRPPPWEGRALLPAMALLVLDVGLDFKTLLDFLVARHYLFAAVMTFIVIRSTLKQFTILAPWKLRQAIKASRARGLLREDLLHFLDEERRSEAFFCGCITAYAILYAAQTAGQLIIQLCSLLLSTWLFSGYAVRLCDMDMEGLEDGDELDSAVPADLEAQPCKDEDPAANDEPKGPDHAAVDPQEPDVGSSTLEKELFDIPGAMPDPELSDLPKASEAQKAPDPGDPVAADQEEPSKPHPTLEAASQELSDMPKASEARKVPDPGDAVAAEQEEPSKLSATLEEWRSFSMPVSPMSSERMADPFQHRSKLGVTRSHAPCHKTAR
ncbi:unnamed protein product [Symbiodinium natans]|uniref:Uncharacterized protein n=1 Tax=Symbiodinium natans TaxID=878477 RepID=A0A812R0M7_9DINO|nr:unnamed protein product [Symbiodinium natans]